MYRANSFFIVTNGYISGCDNSREPSPVPSPDPSPCPSPPLVDKEPATHRESRYNCNTREKSQREQNKQYNSETNITSNPYHNMYKQPGNKSEQKTKKEKRFIRFRNK